MVDPQGKAWSIPQDKVQDAINKGGYKLSVDMTDPQGKQWHIPFDQQDRAQKEGKYTWDTTPDNESLKHYMAPQASARNPQQTTLDVAGGMGDTAQDFFNAFSGRSSFQDISAGYAAYKQSRARGGSVSDAMLAATSAVDQRHNVIQGLQDAHDAFAKNPTRASAHALSTLAATAVLGGLAEGAAAPKETVAEPVVPTGDVVTSPKVVLRNPFRAQIAEDAAKPSVVEQVAARNATKAPIAEGTEAATAPAGENIQPILQQGVRTLINKTNTANGLPPVPDEVSIMDAAQHQADAFQTRSQATFDQVTKITGVDPTALKQVMATRADQIEIAVASGDMEKAGTLQQLQLADENRVAKAFETATSQGADVTQARSDWNKSLRADELSSAIRSSKSNVSTLKTPDIDPSKLTTRFQKLHESQPGGKASKLSQLMDDDDAIALVEHAETARGDVAAIKDFVPSTSTGRVALQELLRANTGKGWIRTAAQSFGFSPKTDYIGAFRDFNGLSAGDAAARFGSEAPAVRAFLQKQAAWQIGKILVKGVAGEEILRRTGISAGLLRLILGSGE